MGPAYPSTPVNGFGGGAGTPGNFGNPNPSQGRSETPSFFVPTPTQKIRSSAQGVIATPQGSQMELMSDQPGRDLNTFSMDGKSATFTGLRQRKGNNGGDYFGNTSVGNQYGNTGKPALSNSKSSTSYPNENLSLPANSLLDYNPPMSDKKSNQQRLRRPYDTPGGSSRLEIDLGQPRGLVAKTPGGGNVGDGNSHISHTASLGESGSVEAANVQSPWVTVFGYPTGAASAILRHFQSCGEVHQHRAEPGNWMHILYGSKVQASRALAQNGQYIRIGGDIGIVMIGVKACNENDLVSDLNKKPSSLGFSSRDYRQASVLAKHRLDKPVELENAPKRYKGLTVCKRFWSWVLDW